MTFNVGLFVFVEFSALQEDFEEVLAGMIE